MSYTYLVNEIFESLQGEASFTGTPSVFIRLQGCDVGCGFCDTKHTWTSKTDDIVSINDMLNKLEDTPKYAICTAQELFYLVKSNFNARHIVITGGEPAIYDLSELTKIFIEDRYTVQIETSGTAPVRYTEGTFITVSPKINMTGKLDLVPSTIHIADEIKFPVGKVADIQKLKDLLAKYPKKHTIWLQPLSQNKTATRLCIREATNNNWKVSIQTHKFIGVR